MYNASVLYLRMARSVGALWMTVLSATVAWRRVAVTRAVVVTWSATSGAAVAGLTVSMPLPSVPVGVLLDFVFSQVLIFIANK